MRVGGNTRPDAGRCPKRRRLISPDFLFLVGRQKAKKSSIPSKNDSLSQPEPVAVAVKRQGCDLTSVWSPQRAIGGTLGVASRLETVETWSTVQWLPSAKVDSQTQPSPRRTTMFDPWKTATEESPPLECLESSMGAAGGPQDHQPNQPGHHMHHPPPSSVARFSGPRTGPLD